MQPISRTGRSIVRPAALIRAEGMPLRLGFIATATLSALLSLAPADVSALALGRLSVQSALGDNLLAEIDVPEISPEEASSLRVGLASPEAYRAAGMDVSSALASLRIELLKRPNGRHYLRVSSSRPVNEPFLDLIIEANWATGRLVRDYTVLLDPPQLRERTPDLLPPALASQPLPSQTAITPQAVPAPARLPSSPAVSPAQETRPVPPERKVAVPAPAPKEVRETETPDAVKVQPGDTAGKIARTHRPADVSLEQMLLALLQANPHAFVQGNVNRLKAGTVLNLPSANQAAALPATEARQMIAAQSRDFNEFRRRLAGVAPMAATEQTAQQVRGQIQTEVKDQRPTTAPQDKLTVAKADAGATQGAEAQLASQRAQQEAAARAAELNRNVQDLNKLGASIPAGSVPATNPPANPAPNPTASLPVPSNAGMTPPAAPASAPEAGTAVTAAESNPSPAPAPAPEPTSPPTVQSAPTPSPAPVPPAAPAPEDPGFAASLLDNPLVLPAAGGLIALLAGLAFVRLRKQKQAQAPADSSFLESRLQPDSFFGSTGGRKVNTAEGTSTGSSMVYSPSQLEAAGDVDPVAEADVYLAYGRDLQAEEILKEALRENPTRLSIHGKLLEIYAKRRDARAFQVLANEVYDLTQGQGNDWEHACVLGRQLDPDNTLYRPGGAIASPDRHEPTARAPFAPATNTVPLQTPGTAAGDGGLPVDVDLDFDLDLPTESVVTPAAGSRSAVFESAQSTTRLNTSAVAPVPPPVTPSAPIEPTPLEFNLDFPVSDGSALPSREALSKTPKTSSHTESSQDDGFLNLSFDLDDASPPSGPTTKAPVTPPPSASDDGMVMFNLDDLSLDLPATPSPTPSASSLMPMDEEEDNLATKLSLAEEFRSIGDLEAARALAEEVMAEGSGNVKTKARQMLAELG